MSMGVANKQQPPKIMEAAETQTSILTIAEEKSKGVSCQGQIKPGTETTNRRSASLNTAVRTIVDENGREMVEARMKVTFAAPSGYQQIRLEENESTHSDSNEQDQMPLRLKKTTIIEKEYMI